MDKSDIRLLDENIAQYSRHNFTCIELDDLNDFMDFERWDGLFLDIRSFNTIFVPEFYWKRGTLRLGIIGHPRLYIASRKINDKSLPADASEFEHLRLEGFRLRTKNISKEFCYWKVEPVYHM
jgi:hypothetical protein